jgi:hypothetical protein
MLIILYGSLRFRYRENYWPVKLCVNPFDDGMKTPKMLQLVWLVWDMSPHV